MSPQILRRGSDRKSDVERLQTLLKGSGFDIQVDGLFGPGTETAVRSFQETRGLVADGIVGPSTWRALDPEEDPEPAARSEVGSPELVGFKGDVEWIHKWEGHAGRPYWPKGQSGVTLDPGLDLGHASPALIEEAYSHRLSEEQSEAVQSVLGLKGEDAERALRANTVLQSIRVSRQEAGQIFPLVAKPYWNKTKTRFSGISSESAPGAVHTAMLSISYNRGASNRKLGVLADPISRSDWRALGNAIASMQQDHKLEGIRRRRREEGALILAALG